MTAAQSTSFRIDCSYCPIRHRAVCAKCEPDELDLLNRIKIYKTCPAGQVIAIRGEQMDMVASIVSGTAMVTRSITDGRTQMIGLLLPSDFIGRPGREAAPYDITAITDVTLCCFRKRPFEQLLLDMPHVQERLLEMALDELDAARDWMLLLGRKTARERIASLLSLILRRAKLPEALAERDCRIELPISREAIANYLGLTIETVSRQLTRLAKDGIIRIDGKRGIIVPDVAELMAETGDDSDGGVIA
ncbi:Crp/Fnr family transcriptional regulator [Paracoccus sp. M683]|uniref:transcriptional regulator FnrL n=1 Tax=Paracoccus sp. M683 TaxID=2594268 RepID=UPI00117FF8B1|nr:Crp/Fnr family transcriptional regulator [Paracoccus sp. M683]TRW99552.1 Crp/Fnr family transcriptional regulator [Paracoccus sp. M683]